MAVRSKPVLALDATKAPIEQLGIVISWRLSETRNRVLGTPDIVELLYVINAANCIPSKRLAESITRYEKSPHYDKHKVEEIRMSSAVRTFSAYCGYWNLAKLRFIDDIGAIGDHPYETLDYREEIKVIMENKGKIDADEGTVENRRRELRETLSEIVLPEFDRLELGITAIEDNTKAIEADTKAIKDEHGAALRQIADKLGIPRP
jgi:hypothetical protein